MKNIIIMIAGMMLITTASFGYEVYVKGFQRVEASRSLFMYPKQFTTEAEAQQVAATLKNGEVFHDYEHHLYQVWYGEYPITGVVVVGSMSDN